MDNGNPQFGTSTTPQVGGDGTWAAEKQFPAAQIPNEGGSTRKEDGSSPEAPRTTSGSSRNQAEFSAPSTSSEDESSTAPAVPRDGTSRAEVATEPDAVPPAGGIRTEPGQKDAEDFGTKGEPKLERGATVRKLSELTDAEAEDFVFSTYDMSRFLEEAGFAQSSRTIQKKCASGELVAVWDESRNSYVVSKKSAHVYLRKLQERNQRNDYTAPAPEGESSGRKAHGTVNERASEPEHETVRAETDAYDADVMEWFKTGKWMYERSPEVLQNLVLKLGVRLSDRETSVAKLEETKSILLDVVKGNSDLFNEVTKGILRSGGDGHAPERGDWRQPEGTPEGEERFTPRVVGVDDYSE